MGKGSANPVEQWRKKEKKKLQKKHTEEKIKTRSALLMQKEPDQILADIRRIQWAERQGLADPKMMAQKRRLLEIHRNVSEKKQAEMERSEKEKSVVVKGLTKLLGRPTTNSKPAAAGSKVDQELHDLMQNDLSAPDDDGILDAPPNLAAPRIPAAAPWSAPTAPTEIWQPYGPPLQLPGVRHRQPAPPAQNFIPAPRPPAPPAPADSGRVLQSAAAIRARGELCTEFLPTNMLLNARRRQEAAPAKRRKPAADARPVAAAPSQTRESAESAYSSFLSEIGD